MLANPKIIKPTKTKEDKGFLSALYTTILLRHLEGEGGNGLAAIRDAGIEGLYPDDDARTAPYSLYRNLCDAAERHMGDPLINIKAVKDSETTTWGVAFYAVVSQPTMVEVVDVSRDLISTSCSMLDLVLKKQEDGVVMRIIPAVEGFDDEERLSEMLLGVVLCALERALHRSLLPVEVRFKHPARGEHELYETRLGAPVVFGTEHTEIFMAADVVNAPTVRPDRHLSSLMSDQMHNRFEIPHHTEEIDRLVVAMLERAKDPEHWKLEGVADKLGVSPRTLQNKLAAQGATFKILVDGVRKEKAELLLRSPKTLTEIAYQLGFTDTSGFTRAFSRWHGVSPSDWRVGMAKKNN